MIDFETLIRSALAETDADTLAKAFTEALNKVEDEKTQASILTELETRVEKNTGIMCPPYMDLEDAVAIATIVVTRKHADWTQEDATAFLRAVYDFAETVEAITHKAPDAVFDMVIDMVNETLDKIKKPVTKKEEEEEKKKKNDDVEAISKFLASIGL